MELQNAKGVRDFLPEEKIARQHLMELLKSVFELYGYNPLETPAIELFEILASKYAGGAEILQETFKLKDRGGRELALRYDLTVPFSRVVGMNPQLKMPFKRYQMDKVWRDGPTGLGRYREFWQCDVDLVGSKSMVADAEILSMVYVFFNKIGLAVEILLNNRKLLNGILESTGMQADKEQVILCIDKLRKTGREGVIQELKNIGLSEFTSEEIMDSFEVRGSNQDILDELKKKVKSEEGIEGIKELEELLAAIKMFGVENVKIDISLARGLAFYTGPVFETFLLDSTITSAVASGGRYNKIIAKFLDSKEEYPATGISFGLDRIYDAMKAAGKIKVQKTVTKAFVIPIKMPKEGADICMALRKNGVNTEIDIVGRNINKNMEYANSQGIPFVIFVGAEEVKQGKIKVREMAGGKEQLVSIDEACKIIMSGR